MDPGDNGIYVIEGWRIVERLRAERRGDGPPRVVRFAEEREQRRGHGFDEMLRAFDEAMPERLRLGEFLDAVEVPVGELRARREGAAIAYLAENGADEGPVRFDDVSLVIVAPDRALVRHHINSLSAAEESLGGKEALTEVA